MIAFEGQPKNLDSLHRLLRDNQREMGEDNIKMIVKSVSGAPRRVLSKSGAPQLQLTFPGGKC